ncbi:hypothetical protein D3C76_621320 [compost metagenome]|uniref:Uncharacterized protein n=1 Tax=Pseudomonas jinjuensis TaxID=198616 RepID=A0A1H0ABL6_9PSED|nr:hypothetical protein [Pseudomonas jinjuensis]SDN30875.1 hypothetical protein SAMN05216193_102167 [Pseudomonas jinjuensis]
MSTLECTYRNYTIHADVMEHPGLPTPWAGGCHIVAPDGKTTKRKTLPLEYAFMADLEKAQHASIAHGKWLVDQCLDHDRQLF